MTTLSFNFLAAIQNAELNVVKLRNAACSVLTSWTHMWCDSCVYTRQRFSGLQWDTPTTHGDIIVWLFMKLFISILIGTLRKIYTIIVLHDLERKSHALVQLHRNWLNSMILCIIVCKTVFAILKIFVFICLWLWVTLVELKTGNVFPLKI